MAQKRSEFYKSLNQMRDSNQTLGNPLINNVDDSTDVGKELSYYAFANKPLDFTNSNQSESIGETDAEEQSKRNGWQRLWDTANNFGNGLLEGVLNFVDDIFDAGAYTVGLFGDNSFKENIKDVINFDWQGYVVAANDQLNIQNKILSGDIFGGEYWENYSKLVLDPRSITEETKKNSFINDSSKLGAAIQNTIEGIGYLLPSVALALATGGASTGVQIATQATVAGVGAVGRGAKTALNEGSEYYSAGGYGAVKGVISAGVTALTMGIGANALGGASGISGKAGNAIGSKVYQLTGKKSAEVFASKATEALTRAGISATSAFAETLTDPLVKQITYDSDAIAEAYGDNESVKNTLQRASLSAVSSAATSIAISTVRETANYASRGKDGYYADYYTRKTAEQQNLLAKKIKSLNNDIKNGNTVDIEARIKEIDKINSKIESYGAKSLEYVDNIIKNSYKNSSDKYNNLLDEKKFFNSKEELEISKNSFKIDFGKNKDIIDRFSKIGNQKIVTDLIRNNININNNSNSSNSASPLGLSFSDDGIATIKTPGNPNQKFQVISYKNEVAIVKPDGAKLTPTAINNLPSTILLSNGKQSFAIDTSKFNSNELTTLSQLDTTDLVQEGNKYYLPLDTGRYMVFSNDEGSDIYEGKIEGDKNYKTTDIFDGEVVEGISDSNPVAIPKEYIKDSANLNNLKVYNYSEAKNTLKEISKEILSTVQLEDSKAKVTYNGEGILKTSEELFNLINKKNVTSEEVLNGISKIFRNIEIKSNKNGSLSTEKLSKYLDGNLQNIPEIKKIVNDNLTKLVSEGGKTAKMEAFKNFYKETKDVLINKIKEAKNKQKADNKFSKLVNRINKKIESGSKNYFSAPNSQVLELTAYKNIMDGVTTPMTNSSVRALTNNIIANYTSDNLGAVLENYGMKINDAVQEVARMLNDSITPGKPLTSQQMSIANELLKVVNDEMAEIKGEVISSNRQMVRSLVNTTQSLVPNKASKDNFVHKVSSFFSGIDKKIRSPINILENTFGSNNQYVIHLSQNAKDCANNTTKIKNELLNEIKGSNFEKITKLSNKEIEFSGYKITQGQALKILNIKDSVGDDLFYQNGGAMHVGGKLVYLKELTPEVLDNLKNQIIPELLEFNKNKILGSLNGPIQDYTQKKFKEITGFEMKLSNNEGRPYYMTSRVGDKATDIKVHGGSISPSDWGLPFLKERNNKSNLPYNFDGDVITDIGSHINRLTQWGEWATWYRTLRTMEDTRLYGSGTSFNSLCKQIIPEWDTLNDFIHHTALGVPYDKSYRLLDKVGGVVSNIQQVAMMDVFTQLKTLGSAFTGWQYFGTSNSLKGLVKYIADPINLTKKAYANIKKYSPTLYERFKTSEAFSANLGKQLKGKTNKFFSTIVRNLDEFIHLSAYSTAEVKVLNDHAGEGLTEEQLARLTVREVEFFSDTTQPTTTKFRVGMYRSGALGKLTKQMFGMFQSMGQNIYQGFYDNTMGVIEARRRIKAYKSSIDEHNKKIDEYQAKMNEAKNTMESSIDEKEINNARENFENAKFHKEGHENARDDIQDALNKDKAKYNSKNWINQSSAFIFGLIGSGLALQSIAELSKRVYGKEDFGTFDAKEFTDETLYKSFVNWIPIVGTFANAIKNDTDLTVFTVQNMNSILDNMKILYSSIQEGDIGHISGATLTALNNLASLFGVPASSIWKLVNGIWYNIDKDSNTQAKNWLGMLTSSSLKVNYTNAVEKLQEDRAIANIDTWLYGYSAGTTNEISKELYRLDSVGITGYLPRELMKSYENEKGEVVKLSSKEKNTFQSQYSKATADINELIKSFNYKSLDDEYKGKSVKKIYDVYYEYAKCKTLGTKSTNALTNLLLQTNGKIKLSKFVAGKNILLTVNINSNKSRKEQILAEVNKLKGFSKAEKLLLLHLCGYSLSDKNKALLNNYLVQNGMSVKNAKNFTL